MESVHQHEQCIQNMARIGKNGMNKVDEEIISIMKSKSVNKEEGGPKDTSSFCNIMVHLIIKVNKSMKC